MKKELVGDKVWRRGDFYVEGDDEPNNSIIGRVRVIHEDSIICLKNRAQVKWLIESLTKAAEYAWGKK